MAMVPSPNGLKGKKSTNQLAKGGLADDNLH